MRIEKTEPIVWKEEISFAKPSRAHGGGAKEEKSGDFQSLWETDATSTYAAEKQMRLKKKRKKNRKEKKKHSQLLCRAFQTLSSRLRLSHLPGGSASYKVVQAQELMFYIEKNVKQAVSRKFVPVLDIHLCRIPALLKQAGSLTLLIKSTNEQHGAGVGTDCFHHYHNDLPEETSMRQNPTGLR